jgi:hypothetical protein
MIKFYFKINIAFNYTRITQNKKNQPNIFETKKMSLK